MQGVKFSLGLAVFGLFVLILACHEDKGDNPTRPTGQRPVITSMGSDASELLAGQYTSVYCDAHDPDGDSVMYLWSADHGTFPEGGQRATVRWVAPSNPCTALITCTVSDGQFNTSMDIGIIIKPKP